MGFDEPKLDTAKSPQSLESYRNEIETPEQHAAFLRALETTQEVTNSAGYQIGHVVQSLRRSHTIVNRNYDTLTKVFERTRDLSGESRVDVSELNDEFLTAFSNYVTTVKSRENHTKDTVLPELESYHVLGSINDEYQQKVSELNVDLHGYFFTSLRNFFVHDGIPETVLILGSGGGGKDHFTIPKKELIESDDFTAEARGYADSWDNHVDIEEAVDGFHTGTKALYDWLFTRIDREYEGEFARARRIDEKARLQQEIFFSSIGTEFMQIQWK